MINKNVIPITYCNFAVHPCCCSQHTSSSLLWLKQSAFGASCYLVSSNCRTSRLEASRAQQSHTGFNAFVHTSPGTGSHALPSATYTFALAWACLRFPRSGLQTKIIESYQNIRNEYVLCKSYISRACSVVTVASGLLV